MVTTLPRVLTAEIDSRIKRINMDRKALIKQLRDVPFVAAGYAFQI